VLIDEASTSRERQALVGEQHSEGWLLANPGISESSRDSLVELCHLQNKLLNPVSEQIEGNSRRRHESWLWIAVVCALGTTASPRQEQRKPCATWTYDLPLFFAKECHAAGCRKTFAPRICDRGLHPPSMFLLCQERKGGVGGGTFRQNSAFVPSPFCRPNYLSRAPRTEGEKKTLREPRSRCLPPTRARSLPEKSFMSTRHLSLQRPC